jgi:hypothetical protein
MFDLDPTYIVASLLLSFVGMGYYSHGKKNNPIFKLCGAGLLIVTFVISSLKWMVVLSIVLMLIPFIVDR